MTARITLSFFFWLTSFLALIHFLHPTLHKYIFIVSVIPVFFFLLLRNQVTFLIMIAFTILSSLTFLGIAFWWGWSSGNQLTWIGVHALLMLHFWSVYILASSIRSLTEANKSLKRRITELEEYVSGTKALSRREFEKQSEIIINTMKRRQEKGYMVSVEFGELPERVKPTSFAKIATAIYDSIRKHYDLVGKYDNETAMYLLQNTNEEGLQLVNDRIIRKLKESFTDEAISLMNWVTEEIGKPDDQAKKGIHL
ncbi:hypothetical protein [Thalassobacillus pellis]|uniref:hypothetical protein n=1 Tax=Thalassobacillus pellis TaxID=748008 RepID=UPI00195FB4EA|nr:hypothetical protein [Thalassobacillus pellis]MBM7554170.1 energy-coupling factor transporter transmembrane protein EcfT [Thalassobacillus pellis]